MALGAQTTPFAMSSNARIQLHNVDGVNVALTSLITVSSSTSYSISLSSLPHGVYALVISNGSWSLKHVIAVKR